MIIVGMAAARRRMRQHQGIPPRTPREPLRKLLLGEAGWALRQLVHEPRVLAALLVGGAVSLAVLDAAAPGPVLPWPGRVVVSMLSGLALARGTWAWIRRRARAARRGPGAAPAVAATEVVAALTGLLLVVWLVVWSVTLVA